MPYASGLVVSTRASSSVPGMKNFSAGSGRSAKPATRSTSAFVIGRPA